ncbi:MAG: phosphoribosylamine--glycine ligase [Candidatus Peribacteraceae bacterium]|nr:phosphoribosylamine--glycine ligase [Candidatus Peribacteraceae bacterium]
MRVLLIASSAREHAIADALSRSRHHPDIISVCTTANPGIRNLSVSQHVQSIMDFDSVLEIAKKSKPDFAFIGPDDPIGGGLADLLASIGIPSVAPKKTLARIEASKGFARNLLRKHGINASPLFRVYTSMERKDMINFIDHDLKGAFVVKYDALRGGKGVKVSGEHLSSVEEGIQYAKECIRECGSVVLEEKLTGIEFSLLSFVSGTQVVDMPAVQDHKRAYEGDTGPNTGGMGTYTDANHSLPFLSKEDIRQASAINRHVAEALQEECGEPYRGVLYGGFMAVVDGIRVIEYNARLGDPEALNILPLLSSDFVDICQAILQGALTEELVSFEPLATVCKYITPKSYPVSKEQQGQLVTFPEEPEQARIFYGDITQHPDGSLHLGGSRTAGIVGIAPTIAEAEHIAEELCHQVSGPVRFRSDIGTAALIQKRIETMRALRNANK